ncbi:pyruvate carboxylase [Gonapodya sp. JEL0774]|nr:pyruvate carboxylase [Gonapodya sp. JEL0774]
MTESPKTGGEATTSASADPSAQSGTKRRFESYGYDGVAQHPNTQVETGDDSIRDLDSTDPFSGVDPHSYLSRLGDSTAANRSEVKVLVANRGEIAIRVIRSTHELGYRSVAVFSFEDRLSQHRYKADEAFQIGGDDHSRYSPVGAYLAIDEVIAIAKSRGVHIIHPGYGFLSENSEFARKCEAAGIAFAGPKPETIDACGDKTKARDLAIRNNVPVIPGSGPLNSPEEAVAFAKSVGLPIILKAAFGGGGRGMRVVRDIKDLPDLFNSARSEALTAFGDGTIFLEKFVERPRHIEVQLLGDGQGNVIHLYDRDCSVQRRHQKVVEMGPALGIDPETRKKMLADAVKMAKDVNYRNAGTAEFLLDRQGKYYFIEINPRIQVEHTVTEEITGVDLIALQLRIAQGSSLPSLGVTQESIAVKGHALQCRMTTEDPAKNFQPDTGRIEAYRSPGGPGVRLDGGNAFAGAIVSPHYDSLLTKITCRGQNFEDARRRMIRALVEFRIRGIKTNVWFLTRLLTHPTFVAGTQMWTTFIDDTPELLQGVRFRNRASKLLFYLADIAVNGSRVKGQNGVPTLRSPIPIPTLPSVPYEVATTTPCTEGWRNVLLKEGPEGFCRAIRAHKGCLIMDTTWRDAHQSLLATRVRTVDMARVATTTSYALKEAFALEMWGGATFDVALRFLWEDPWERLTKLREMVPNVPFQMLLRGANAVGYTSYPDNVVYEFCKVAREKGIDVFRVFDSLNYLPNLELGIDAVKKAGGVAEGTISYTGDVSDPRRTKYSLEYYIDLTDQLVKMGIHILGIKDMAGLLKPKAATMLVGAIRRKYPDLVIHVHTHDTPGTGVASMLACAEAGADIVDAAVDSMSGLTSQPSMGAIVAALAGSDHETGIPFENVSALNSYWEQVRLLYSVFDPGLKSGDSGVYLHEMPGGQYTNLLFQAHSLGLGAVWNDVKRAYIDANLLCGDIVKVTPSSKVVGDFAQFMVSNKLSKKDVEEKAGSLSFPTSVVEYFQGYLGQPPGGFPEPLRSKIIRNLPRIENRPGADLEPLDLTQLKQQLTEKYSKGSFGEGTADPIEDTDVLSAALYPAVFDEFRKALASYGDLSVLPTQYFLAPLQIGEEMQINVEVGKILFVKLLAIGPTDPLTGNREVFFALNGQTRMVQVHDDKAAVKAIQRVKADPNKPGDVSCPMSGVIVEVRVKHGAVVRVGDPLAVLSAMKMETIVAAPVSGVVDRIEVSAADSLNQGDLICSIIKDSIDPSEIAKFSQLAESWWDPDGPSKMLHLMNGARVGWIRECITRNMTWKMTGMGLEGIRILDVGCGGGFLTEPLARLGAEVVGVDAARQNVQVAISHAMKDPMLRRADGTCIIDYRNSTAESLLADGEKFDVVCAMEILEHVVDPVQFVELCSGLLKPSSLLLVSTISRTPLSYFLTVFLAENLFRIVPPGTHDYSKYRTPSEVVDMMRRANLDEVERKGVCWNPLLSRWEVGGDGDWETGANFFIAGRAMGSGAE